MFLVLFLGAIGVAFWGIAVGLRRMARATWRKEAWVTALPRIAFPLLFGTVGTRYLFGSARLAYEMGSWYIVLNAVSVVLCSLAMTSFVMTYCIRKTVSEEAVVSFLTLLLSVIGFTFTLTLF